MKKIWVYCYFTYVFIAFIFGIILNYSCKEYSIIEKPFKIDLFLIALLVLVATSLSFWAVTKFENSKITIQEGIKKLSIEEAFQNKIEKRFTRISSFILKMAIVILGFLPGYVVVDKASLDWKTGIIKLYAFILVSVLIGTTFYAYVYFIVIILSIKDVYNLEFEKYIIIYPIATEVFLKYTPIYTSGLILFWIIGFILITLSIIVFNEEAFLIVAIIGGLILFGYIFFTFYPYYITRKKVNMLKLQTIRMICGDKDLLDRNAFDQYSEIIKFVLDSPDVMSTNFHLIITSSLAAIIGLITSVLSFFK